MSGAVVWHRLILEEGRPVLSGATGKAPKRGVWVACLERRDGGQTSTEAIAVDGVEVMRFVCWSGYDRAQAFAAAGRLLREWRGKR